MRRAAIVAALALMVGSVALGAQESIEQRLASRLDEGTRNAVVALVNQAQRDGLPVEPLVDVSLEGAQKRASGALIVKAVRNRLHDLTAAREALGPSSTSAEVMAGAEALRRGISVEQLEQVRASRAGVRVASSLTALGHFLASGVPPDTAIAITKALVRVAASDDQVLGVARDVETDIRAGRPAEVAASTRVRALEQVILASGGPNSGAQNAALPSGRGTTRSQTPGLAGQAAGAAVGARVGETPAQTPQRPIPPPRGKPSKRP
jgi:hypothetical protein